MHKLGECEACVLDSSTVSRGCPYSCGQVYDGAPEWVVKVGKDRYILVECKCKVGRRVAGDERRRHSLLVEVGSKFDNIKSYLSVKGRLEYAVAMPYVNDRLRRELERRKIRLYRCCEEPCGVCKVCF
jgi:hypothetical protein